MMENKRISKINSFEIIKTKLKSIFQLICIFSLTTLFAQDVFKDKNIVTAYQEYTKLPRELAYIHLNKSTYIKGEDIGFTAYVLDKSSKKFSNLTKNLYCVITNKNEKIIKSKLIKVDNGISNGLFSIDTLFTSGNYTFKAYTNWMQNFDEKNFFAQTIRIIDPDVEDIIKPRTMTGVIDAQILPEGGHLVANTKNIIGVVLKDGLGLGIPKVEGQLIEGKNNFITKFKVNELGIGRFSFTPELNKDYKVKLNYLNKDYTFKITKADFQGIVVSLNQRANNVSISFRTNRETLPLIKDKYFKLVVHNGIKLSVIDIVFNNKLEINKLFKLENLFPGMNIFTLFDVNNNPIVERLFFNHKGVRFVKSDSIIVNKELDSLLIKLNYKNIDPNKFNNLSISILPTNTNSYLHHHNIASYLLLQPYVKGYIENAQYYFTQIDRKKIYELDNLLLTQGWSSYNWKNIFNNLPNSYFAFENGIGVVANIVSSTSYKFMLYPIGEIGLKYYEPNQNKKTLEIPSLFPSENDKFTITEIDSKGILKRPNLSIQFFPSNIPNFNLKYNALEVRQKSILRETQYIERIATLSLDREQNLDEISLLAKLDNTRIENIKRKAPYGKVDVFNKQKRGKDQTLADYLRQRGYTVRDLRGEFRIYTIDPRTLPAPGKESFVSPIVYVDGMQIFDLSIISDYKMDMVDYIEINKNGIGGGAQAGGGVIKIKTLSLLKRNIDTKQKNTLANFKIPLTFSSSKKYYAPLYSSHQNDFFIKYGVIDWLPVNKMDDNRNYIFNISSANISSLKLFIQGMTYDGSYISEIKTINL
ncbi:MAG: hypothetical protein GQ552_08430 [Flavobacteriaceae bacterium]|nr:hypothetical protein [Flavobacteriaceae bacterium]